MIPLMSPGNGEKKAALQKVFGLRPAVAVGACAVTAVLGSAMTYAVAEPSPSPHTYYACAHGAQMNAGSITVDETPSCSKSQALVSWNQNGVAGPTGATGAAGVDGQNGAAGATGAPGVNGHDGATGSTGSGGATGAAGERGQDGVAGPTGATGATGPSGGPTGPTGLTGAAGAPGARGSNGVSGYQVVSKNGMAPHGGSLTDYVACPTGKLPIGGNAYGTGSSPLAIKMIQSAVIGASWGVVIENTDASADWGYTMQAVCATVN